MAADDQLALTSEIARAIRHLGGRALIVGGWVRDRLLGLDSKDIDVEVYGLPAASLRDLLEGFGRVDTVGESFTVYKVGGLDVSLPRRESKVGRGHKGFAVTGDPALSFDDAFRRRDFTVNAIGWDPLTSDYIDPFQGREDLGRRTLRAVDPATFGDDSLRVLRAIQFAARFEFTIDAGTAALCRTLPLDDLPHERIWGELEKLLLRAARPSIGFTWARELDVTTKLFPELHALIDCPQEPEWHPEGDVWTHTLMVVDQARSRIDDLSHACQVALMLGAACHDFGKPATTAFIDGRIRSLEHEPMGVPPAVAFLDRLNVHSIDGYDVRAQVLGMVAHHLKPGAFYQTRDTVTDGAFRRLAQRVDLELLARLAKSDCTGRTGEFDCTAMDWFLDRARALGVEHEPPKPLVLGRHLLALGMSPGPDVGAILKQIYERQLDGAITSTEEGIEVAKRLLATTEATENTKTDTKRSLH
jgi:tRNA nucleotidyltransferase (CCA-adding enzyme)